jgi:hypothetical protein
LHLKEQIARDRRFGFAEVPAGTYTYTLTNQVSFAGSTYSAGDTVELGCDVSDPATGTTGNNFFGFGAPAVVTDEQRLIRLATTFCSVQPSGQPAGQPKFPSLYYLFPVVDHVHEGNDDTAGGGVNHEQPTSEPYVGDVDDLDGNGTQTEPHPYIADASVNGSYTYEAVTNLPAMILQPRPRGNWQLPFSTTDTGIENKVNDNGTDIYVSFMDKAFFDGRQLMQVRALDVDLNLLRQTAFATVSEDTNNNGVLDAGEDIDNDGVIDTNITNFLLPNSGIVYAFREDAVREDAIARPASEVWANCNTDATLTTADCRMNAEPVNTGNPQDPPVNEINGISPKPVDYYADPDRRPYGFRLRNGQDLSRGDSRFGISFLSDNPVYIQGNFNLHSSDGTAANLKEEFQVPGDQLAEDWDNFYDRATLDTGFAQRTADAGAQPDTWRLSEILSDSISILSTEFCDGTIASGIRNNNDPSISGCQAGQTSSYRNSTFDYIPRPGGSLPEQWVCENPSDPGVGNVQNPFPVPDPNVTSTGTKIMPKGCESSPIEVTRNAEVNYKLANGTEEEFTNYLQVIDPRRDSTAGNRPSDKLNDAGETRVNSVLVSGLVPSRAHQSYGGFHNFPRLTESWEGTNLFIGGSFLQLNFSTYGTAPFDQDAWEPNQLPDPNAVATNYTFAPNRRWGYDVALQYNPPGPVTERFLSAGSPRSEFYQELAADDPYIENLRCAQFNGNRIDPNATCQ